ALVPAQTREARPRDVAARGSRARRAGRGALHAGGSLARCGGGRGGRGRTGVAGGGGEAVGEAVGGEAGGGGGWGVGGWEGGRWGGGGGGGGGGEGGGGGGVVGVGFGGRALGWACAGDWQLEAGSYRLLAALDCWRLPTAGSYCLRHSYILPPTSITYHPLVE